MLLLQAMPVFRFGQGTDYFAYRYIYNQLSSDGFDLSRYETLHGEIGYLLLCNLFRCFKAPFELFAACAAILEIGCFDRFCEWFQMDSPFVLVLAYPTLYMTYFVSAIRQGSVTAVFQPAIQTIYCHYSPTNMYPYLMKKRFTEFEGEEACTGSNKNRQQKQRIRTEQSMQKNNASRTENVTKNLIVGAISKGVLLGATFAVRTLFIRILGAEYTGISSLYSNILSLLNLAELGFGSVLTYELYRPLKDNDEETVAALVALFKKIYTVIIAVVLTIGLLLIPFLKYIVSSNLNQTELLTYYILYLADSVASYFVAYRTMVIEADQKRYITNLVDIASKFVMYICQSVYLVVTRDFLGYLILQVLFTVLKNITLHLVSLKMYPYLKLNRKAAADRKIDAARIYENVKATCIAKISNVVLSQTDSIIISVMMGTICVGYYSNYYMLIVYVNSIYNMLITSMEASVGNLNAEGDTEKSYSLYKKISFLIMCMNVFCVAEFMCVIQDFIGVWIGQEYIQSQSLAAALMITLYFQQAMNAVMMYRQTMGLFEAVKKAYPVMAALNIVLSVAFGKIMGMAGVALATGISRLISVFWYEGKVVFEALGRNVWEYLFQQGTAAMMTGAATAVSLAACSLISATGVSAIAAKALLTMGMVWMILWALYGRSEEYRWMTGMLKKRFS